jgi:hypothetical protein
VADPGVEMLNQRPDAFCQRDQFYFTHTI